MTIETVAAEIVSSPEYLNDAGNNNTTFVQHLYQQILGRSGSTSEVNGWVSVLKAGASHYQVALDFLTSMEYRTDLIAGGPWTPYTSADKLGRLLSGVLAASGRYRRRGFLVE